MTLIEHRYQFLISFFKNYCDINIDLKMRLYPLLYSNNDYDIQWIDFTNKKILLLNEKALMKKYTNTKKIGLINYYLTTTTINDSEYINLQINFINAYEKIETFIDIFNKYFDKKFSQNEFDKFIKDIVYINEILL